MTLLDYVARIPLAKLVKLTGSEIINGLQEFGIAEKPREIAKILYNLYGTNLFRSREFRRSLIHTLDETDLKKLCMLHKGTPTKKVECYRDSLLQSSWGANNFSIALLKFFQQDPEHFIPSAERYDDDSELVIPRLSTTNPDFEGVRISIPEMFPLHSYQKTLKDRINDEVFQEGARFILHMPTGSGKTKTTVESLLDFWRVNGKRNGFVIWLAHSKELCEQAYLTFRDTWQAKGDFAIRMFKVFEHHTPDLSGIDEGIVFMGFQKFYALLGRTPPHKIAIRLRDNARVVVVDEAHRSLAPTYARVIEYLTLSRNTRLLGLTATPGRSADLNDHENQVLAHLYRDHKLSLCDAYGVELADPISYLQDNKYLAKLDRITVDSKFKFTREETLHLAKTSNISEQTLHRLSTDALRNAKIVQEIEKAVAKKKTPMLVFATSVSHAIILKVLLARQHITAECVLGNTPGKNREQVINDFKRGALPVLINYHVLTTGFDSPNIRTLVICRPTNSIVLYSQMLGRALRGPKMGGLSEQNTVIDVIDNYGNLGTEKAAFNYFDDYFNNCM